MGLSVFDESFPTVDQEDINNAWGVAQANVIGGTSHPERLDALIFTSDDTIDHDIQFWSTSSLSPVTLLGTVSIPAGSGTTSLLPAIDAAPLLFPTDRGYVMNPTVGLSIGPTVVVTAGKHVYATILGGLV